MRNLLLLHQIRTIAASDSSAQSDYIISLGPIAYYPLNDAANTTAEDLSGNGYDGVYTNATVGAAGIGDGNTAASFDGSTDFIDISAIASAFSGATGSIVAWAKTAAWTDGSVRSIVRVAPSSTHQIYIQKSVTNNTLAYRRQTGISSIRTVTSSILAGSTDYFCAVLTWDTGADAMKAYVNGAQVGTTQTGLGTYSGTPVAIIGASNNAGAESWNGQIAHVAIFDRALTDEEIAEIYATI